MVFVFQVSGQVFARKNEMLDSPPLLGQTQSERQAVLTSVQNYRAKMEGDYPELKNKGVQLEEKAKGLLTSYEVHVRLKTEEQSIPASEKAKTIITKPFTGMGEVIGMKIGVKDAEIALGRAWKEFDAARSSYNTEFYETSSARLKSDQPVSAQIPANSLAEIVRDDAAGRILADDVSREGAQFAEKHLKAIKLPSIGGTAPAKELPKTPVGGQKPTEQKTTGDIARDAMDAGKNRRKTEQEILDSMEGK